MKHGRIILALMALVATLSISAAPALAAKPVDVIPKSNGFPSGEHFNLNIHGVADPENFGIPEPPYGASIFTSLYSDPEVPESIQYESGRRATVTELTVTDPVTQAFDGDAAVVQLPYEEQGYYVFARILATPQNGKTEEASNIILKPNTPVDLQNLVDDGFGGEMAVGLITKDDIYYAGEEQFFRFENTSAPAKGKSVARDITQLFLFSGWVIDDRLDLNDDGVIDQNDVPAILPEGAMDYDLVANGGNGDGILQIDEWLAYNAGLDTPMAWYFAQTWIFNIADLVITDQGLVNDGTKLLQIRFYPVDTTTFNAPGYIIVDKVTNPAGDTTEFQFTSDIAEPFTLADASVPLLIGPIPAGTYTVTEGAATGWSLTDIYIVDPDGGSSKTLPTATVDVDAGETVRLTFINTLQQ